MATFLIILAMVLMVAAFYFVYRRSTAMADATDEQDLERFKLANREILLGRVDHATWDTAMQIARGDEGVAHARYVQLRVRQMKGEAKDDAAP